MGTISFALEDGRHLLGRILGTYPHDLTNGVCTTDTDYVNNPHYGTDRAMQYRNM